MSDDWIFDSLIGFLRGPVWNVPILTFLEHKSLVFEPGEGEDNEEYKKIHDDYKNLVDFMLGSYMEDIQITPQQFSDACTKAKIKTQFQQGLFEQVWAADNYEIFKRMMIQKNIELQLQALELIQQRYGTLPKALLPTEDGGEQEEDHIMAQIVRQSIVEHEALQKALSEEEAKIEQALANNVGVQKKLQVEKDYQETLLIEHMKATKISNETEEVKESEPKSSGTKHVVQAEISHENIDPEELKKRTEFLKTQRDKLLKMKQVERERILAQEESKHAKERPKSASAARSAMGGRGGRQKIDPQTLEVRKALARKLMNEVVYEQS